MVLRIADSLTPSSSSRCFRAEVRLSRLASARPHPIALGIASVLGRCLVGCMFVATIALARPALSQDEGTGGTTAPPAAIQQHSIWPRHGDRPHLRELAHSVLETGEQVVEQAVGLLRTRPHLSPRVASGRARRLADSRRPVGPPAPRLVSNTEHVARRGNLPIIADDELAELLASDDVIFYGQQEMPRAYPKWNGLSAGVHDAFYNISAGAGEPFGNGNREFPWDGAAGTHRSRNVETVHFFVLPRDGDGHLLPIVYTTSPADAQGVGKVTWRFPHGTLFGECLLIRFDADRALPCELRLRRRVESDWEVDVLRPFPTAESLAARIETLRPDWASDPDLLVLVEHLRDPNTLQRGTLRDDHPRRTFDAVAGIDDLPPIDGELAQTLLESTPFVSCAHTDWKTSDNGLVSYSPTTRHQRHIVPANFDGGFVAVDSVSCRRCHDTTGTNVSVFQPRRDWYGDIRGSDGIFSFHPFDRTAISGNGQSTRVSLRADFVEAGILAPFDATKHDEANYSELDY